MNVSWIIPQEKKFFDLIEKEAENLLKAAKILEEMLETFSDMEKKMQEISRLEHEGDTLVHKIFDELNKTFITPLDREDISSLATEMDDILDLIDEVAEKTILFKIEKSDPHLVKVARQIREASSEINLVMKNIGNLKNAVEIKRHCIRINELEHEADAATRKAFAQLFESGDAIEIIKLKELYTNLENATDRCEDVADIIMDLLIKYA